MKDNWDTTRDGMLALHLQIMSNLGNVFVDDPLLVDYHKVDWPFNSKPDDAMAWCYRHPVVSCLLHWARQIAKVLRVRR